MNADDRAFEALLKHRELHPDVPFMSETVPLRAVADSRLSDSDLASAIEEGLELSGAGRQAGQSRLGHQARRRCRQAYEFKRE